MKARRHLLIPALIASAAAPMVEAKAELAAETKVLVAGTELEIKARYTKEVYGPITWSWSVSPAWAANFVELAPDRILLKAPAFLLSEDKITVQATPNCYDRQPGILELQLVPREDGAGGYVGPHMRPLCGSHEAEGDEPGSGSQARFKDLNALAWVGDHPDPKLKGQWLALRADGLRVVTGDGAMVHWEGEGKAEGAAARGTRFPFRKACALAVRGSGEDWEAVIACGDEAVYRMDAKGEVTVLAGLPGEKGADNGPVDKARFFRASGVAFGPDGSVYVSDWYRIRRILKGEVSTVYAQHSILPGRTSHFEALAYHPKSGRLIVVDGTGLFQILPDGTLKGLAGSATLPGYDGRPDPDDQRIVKRGNLRRARFLTNEAGFWYPGGLAVHGDTVFVPDMKNHAVRAVDLESSTVTTVAGHNKDAAFRPGPIPKGRPVRPSDCAALMSPVGIALNPAGQCLVVLQNASAPGNCIVELVLDDKGRSASAGAGGEDKADSKRGTAGESPAPETATLKAVPDAVPSDSKAGADGQ